jgi:hypothetical protein
MRRVVLLVAFEALTSLVEASRASNKMDRLRV